MSREQLPPRRLHESFDIVHWNRRYRIGLGRVSGRVVEVFISSGRSGEQSEVLAHDSAILLSIALQHGVPIEDLSKSIMREPDGKASGPIGALIDHIVKEQNGG